MLNNIVLLLYFIIEGSCFEFSIWSQIIFCTTINNAYFFATDVSAFHGILVKHIHSLLQQRDQAFPSSEKWVLHEACNRNALQHGGTFRNALSRKLDDVIISVFSGVITFIDQFSNLNLIRNDGSCTPVAAFWLAVFNASDVMSFKYGTPINTSINFKDFECKLPFFWIIKEAFDTQWDTAQSIVQASM